MLRNVTFCVVSMNNKKKTWPKPRECAVRTGKNFLNRDKNKQKLIWDYVLGSFYCGVRWSLFVVDHKIERDDSFTRVQTSPSSGVSPTVDFNVFDDAVLALTDATQGKVGYRTVLYSIQEVKSDTRQGFFLVSRARSCVKREVFLRGIYVFLSCWRSSKTLFITALIAHDDFYCLKGVGIAWISKNNGGGLVTRS